MDPALLGPGTRFEGARLAATLDGPFRDLAIEHRVEVARYLSGTTQIAGIVQQGTATYDGARWTLPLDATVARVVTGTAQVDPRLVDGTVKGTLTYQGNKLASDGLALAFPGATARLTLAGDTASGSYRVAGPVTANGLALPDIGTLNGAPSIVAAPLSVAISGRARPWAVTGPAPP